MKFKFVGSALLCGIVALGTSALAQNNSSQYPQTPVEPSANGTQQNQQNYPTQQPNYPNQNPNYPTQQTGVSSPNGMQSYSLPAGTEISVMANQNINSQQGAQAGQSFDAQIENNVVDQSGNVVIPKGAPAQLQLVSTKGALGRSQLGLVLQSVNVNGRQMMLQTNSVQGKNSGGIGANKRTGEYVGGGALIGTVIGAIAGGAKGAAIGAVLGGGAGAGTQVLTKGNQVNVPAETILNFKLDQPVTLE
jgi:hypothetical protein